MTTERNLNQKICQACHYGNHGSNEKKRKKQSKRKRKRKSESEFEATPPTANSLQTVNRPKKHKQKGSEMMRK